jgi:glycosyltransferase involved in cell wall biosynthesis
MKKLSISIIICCYNSTSRIPRVLEALSRLKVSNVSDIELVVVDNNSSDDLIKCVKTHWNSLGDPFELRFVVEKTQGLCFARRAGVLAARYKIGIFCDDDNLLSEDYLEHISEFFIDNPKIGALGGQGILRVPENYNVPTWFRQYEHCYAVGRQAERSGELTCRGYLWGAGLVVRLDILRKIYIAGVEPLCHGRTASNLASGDDGEVCAWLVFAGYQLFYCEELCFEHLIPIPRLSTPYLERLKKGFRYSFAFKGYSGILKLVYCKDFSWSSFINLVISLKYLFRIIKNITLIRALDH